MAIIDRIKFDGLAGRDWMIYRYPGEDFTTSSVLIVGEGQAAVFIKGGQVFDCFTAGTYQLSTANIPLLGAFIKAPFGGKTPFTAEVYFINVTSRLDIRWGTVDPIQVIDPKYHIMLRVRSFGQFGLKITDPRYFLTEIMGTMNPSEAVSYQKLLSFFKGVLMSKVKSLIAEAIIEQKISALELSAKIDDFSVQCLGEIKAEFERFGIKIVNFFVESINFPNEDFEELNKILRDKAAFDIIGDSRYVAKRSFDVMETAAGNQNGVAGAFAGAGVGLGAGMAAGGAMGGAGSILNTQVPAPSELQCKKCGQGNPPASSFCGGCGASLKPEKALCRFCEKESPAGNTFCVHCGKPLNDTVTCGKCGASNSAGHAFCGKCGAGLAE